MKFAKKTIIITGVSSGIGFALATDFLEQGCHVIGVGRKNSIEHPNFKFFEIDLSQTIDFSFLAQIINQSEELLLINNAGIIGNIERISQQNISDITNVMQVNAIAPMMLCQYVLKNYPLNKQLTILNISSGAARRAIPSWASYCSSKAALEMYSETIYKEEWERNRKIKVYSISPGVVDTEMQNKIRKADNSNFSSLHSFIKLKENNELMAAGKVSQKIQSLLKKPYTDQVVYSLRDIID